MVTFQIPPCAQNFVPSTAKFWRFLKTQDPLVARLPDAQLIPALQHEISPPPPQTITDEYSADPQEERPNIKSIPLTTFNLVNTIYLIICITLHSINGYIVPVSVLFSV